MKKIQMIGLALVAMFALGAMVASVASAATLLAEWLEAGKAVTSNQATTATGALLLEDTKAKISVVCKGSLDGTVGTDGTDTITAVLNTEGVEASLSNKLNCEAENTCESGSDVHADP